MPIRCRAPCAFLLLALAGPGLLAAPAAAGEGPAAPPRAAAAAAEAPALQRRPGGRPATTGAPPDAGGRGAVIEWRDIGFLAPAGAGRRGIAIGGRASYDVRRRALSAIIALRFDF
jgi:hypothetical protein